MCLCVVFSIELQIQLVQAYWSELFVIGLAQCSQVMNLSTILTAILNHLQTRLLSGKKPSHVILLCQLLAALFADVLNVSFFSQVTWSLLTADFVLY